MKQKYNLNYFIQLQKNARLYMTGLSIVAFFMAISLCLQMEYWEPKNDVTFLAQKESNQVIAETQNTSETVKEFQPVQQSAKDEKKTEEIVPEIETVLPVTLEKHKTVNLLQIHSFVPPCSVEPIQKYGPGYDSTYDDYRFHDETGYQADGTDIFSVADGFVKQIDWEAEWPLTLQCGEYQVLYRGLQNCNVNVGESVTAGQRIGISEEYLYVKVIQWKVADLSIQ